MTVYYILQNWKEYDVRKRGSGMDPRIFNCLENWEIDFLVERIQHIYTFISDSVIRKAIVKACEKENVTRQRENFVSAVLEYLAVSAN
jgi:transcriptional regulator CtsR